MSEEEMDLTWRKDAIIEAILWVTILLLLTAASITMFELFLNFTAPQCDPLLLIPLSFGVAYLPAFGIVYMIRWSENES